MKKLIPVALFLLVLSGCQKKPKEDAAKGLNEGFVNFATIVVLDDLIVNGIRSDFVSLSPVPVVDPDNTVTAEAILQDFRTDFVDAQDKYPLKLSEGLSLTWNLDHDADGQYGMSFHKEERNKNGVFAGKLSIRFDPEFYSATPYPTYSKDSSATVICRELTQASERKNDYLVWVEVAFDKCLAATDYYASVRNQLKGQQPQLKQRLNHIYLGNEEVSEAIAQKLVTYYETGNAFAPDSVCLTGAREECLSNLKTEIIRKYEDARISDIESLKVKPQSKETEANSAGNTAQPQAGDQTRTEGDTQSADKPPVQPEITGNQAVTAVPSETEAVAPAEKADAETAVKPAEAAPAEQPEKATPTVTPGQEKPVS